MAPKMCVSNRFTSLEDTVNLPSYFAMQGLERKPDEIARQSGLRPGGPSSLSCATGLSGPWHKAVGPAWGREPHS